MYCVPILPLSPASEYSSESNYNYSFDPTTSLMGDLSLEGSASPPPYQHQYHYQDDPSLVQPEAASQPRFSLSPEQHYHYPPQPAATSTRPSPSYPYDVPASTRQSIPSQAPFASYAYSESSMGAFAPLTSAPHASLRSLSNSRYSSDYANILANQSQSTANHPQSPLERSARQSYSLADEDYSSPLPGGLRHGSGAASQDYDVAHLPSSTDSFTLPPISDVIPGPSRPTRSSHRTAPYAVSGGRRPGRVESPVRYLDGRPSTPPLSTIDPLQDSPRRSTRSKKSAAASGLPLEKNFVCKTCDARFARNHDLTRHHKVHDPVKQYRCKGCDRSFTRKDALKRHATTKNCGNDDWSNPTGSRRAGRRPATAAGIVSVAPIGIPGPSASVPALVPATLDGSAHYDSTNALTRTRSTYSGLTTGLDGVSDRPTRQLRHHHSQSQSQLQTAQHQHQTNLHSSSDEYSPYSASNGHTHHARRLFP